jgi:D-xylose transport system permease protein
MTAVSPERPQPAGEPGAPATEESARSGGLAMRIAQLGSLRVGLVLALIWIIFQTQNSHFLSSFNLTNLVLQIAAVGTISVGVVLILLLGEIDLSVGAVSGLADAVPAIVAGLLTGAAIGFANGFFVTRFNIPSFVVTLAGLLAWQGALLKVLGNTGTVNLTNATIVGLNGTFYGEGVGWVLVVLVVGGFVGSGLLERLRRTRAGLAPPPLAGLVVQSAAVAGGMIAAVLILRSDRGIPLAGLILIAFCAVFTFICKRTVFGRHLFAVGGNMEAARRAGINVTRLRIIVFVLASTLAAAGGILAASRLLAVNQASGGSDLLLLAIAGPVIAGTSLFGGRGSAWHALLGALVIGSISNGMDLLALESSVKFMITAGVLLVAVVIDALIKAQRERAGARR